MAVSCASLLVSFGTWLSTSANPELAMECLLRIAKVVICLLLQDEGSMQALAGRMKALLGPFVLRRLKSEVASQLVLKQQRV